MGKRGKKKVGWKEEGRTGKKEGGGKREEGPWWERCRGEERWGEVPQTLWAPLSAWNRSLVTGGQSVG